MFEFLVRVSTRKKKWSVFSAVMLDEKKIYIYLHVNEIYFTRNNILLWYSSNRDGRDEPGDSIMLAGSFHRN